MADPVRDPVVEALIEVLPHIDDHECGSHALGVVADHLPAILRATVPHWSAEDKTFVLRALLRDAALRIYGWPDGSADTLCLAVPLVSVTCKEPLTGAVRVDALSALLALAPESP